MVVFTLNNFFEGGGEGKYSNSLLLFTHISDNDLINNP